ncbi:LLM class flavin-dependent oxidoreductase [Rhizobium panacihumi]|uniref:LLM class flavin-dependent oxidoreductase n=1 Tax=Rhizobium panacihumi TaxID=2008450 RepID=UPI003D7973E8
MRAHRSGVNHLARWRLRGELRTFRHRGPPRSAVLPARRAGDRVGGVSDTGRNLAASHADLIYSRHGSPAGGQTFYRDVKNRLTRHGHGENDLKILPGAAFALGDSQADAEEKLRAIRLQQVSPKNATVLLEQVWNRDLSAYDPKRPLPDVDPEFLRLLWPKAAQTALMTGWRQPANGLKSPNAKNSAFANW